MIPVARRSGENGFTLLEVLISLAILSGVIVTIITVMNSHLAASTRLSDTSTAALVAREALEEALITGVREGKAVEAVGMVGLAIEYTTEEASPGVEKICAEAAWGKDEKVSVCAWARKKI